MTELKKVLTEIDENRPMNGQMVEMTISPEASNLIIDRLIDMYSNKVESVVRELVSNALDATVNNKGDIEITKPTEDSLYFEVRDFGTGMSEEILKDVYTKYGASTKRDDMNQIGAYGLGAKVPLAYSNNFTVETIKDGIKIVGEVLRSGGLTTFEILDKIETTESNGTLIKVPVNEYDIESFENAISNYEIFADTLDNRIYIF